MSGRGRSSSGNGGRGRGRSSGRSGGRGRGGRQNQHPRSAPNTPMKQRGGSANNNNRSQSALSSGGYNRTSRNASNRAPPSNKKDGELGASAHTVSEEYRIQLTQLLMNLRETSNDTDSITLPADLTNTQRKFVHELSKQMGLKSKSYGKGEGRRVVVSKVLGSGGGLNNMMMGGSNNNNNSNQKKKNDGDENDNALPSLNEYKHVPRINVGKQGVEALRRHLKKYPPSKKEEAESKETGSSLLLKINTDDNTVVNEMQNIDTDNGNGTTSLLTLNGILPIPPQDTTNDKSISLTTQQQKLKAKHERMIQQRIQNHKVLQQHTKSSSQYKQMMKQRSNLPAFAYASEICDVLRNKKNQVVILTGDTGCGKSTQVPQFLLDDPQIGPSCSILVTQPRRISAISVAERVASERCQSAGLTVGYSVRLESSTSNKTQLLFCTPGVLMKRLHSTDKIVDDGRSINRLKEYTHIIMDGK